MLMGASPGRNREMYWGARYTRSWLTMLVGTPLSVGIYLQVLQNTSAWAVLAPLTVVIIGPRWLVPPAVVSDKGIRLVLPGTVVPWGRVAAVLDPRAGDEVVRLKLTEGRTVRVPGVPPATASYLRAVRNGRP
ncbi:hypothetical protein [Pseudonocardia alni]|uniref:hypothetical protein n=1 Tax=Pseudonocardia alni TaxID=33907 RepID=UPI001AD6E1FF|nr:hypothetical protein [Pseudonocardia alni]MBO4236151.1 hypothetical protein [Pseudonocardia alni]